MVFQTSITTLISWTAKTLAGERKRILWLAHKIRTTRELRLPNTLSLDAQAWQTHRTRAIQVTAKSTESNDASTASDQIYKSPEKTFEGMERSPYIFLRVKFKHTLNDCCRSFSRGWLHSAVKNSRGAVPKSDISTQRLWGAYVWPSALS